MDEVCATFYPVIVDDRLSVSYEALSSANHPLDFAQKILNLLDEKNHELNSFCDYRRELVLAAAKESTERWKSGKTLSSVDGVPAAVKDQLAIVGHTRKNGLDLE